MTQMLRVTIIGMGRIGTSIGLALKQGAREKHLALHIVGHDREPAHTREAHSRKAIDKSTWNLPHSVEDADLIVLALPVSEIQETLGYIAEDLRPNAVVMDTASLKVPVLRWAEEILPENVHFVGGHPIVRDILPGPEHARADLFQNEIFALCPSPRTNAQAVRLVSDVVTLMGARPLFLDPEEHDSMMAAVEHLPQLLGLALSQTVTGEPSWREMRKLAGAQFEASTYTSAGVAEELAALFMGNRQHLLTWLHMFRRTLQWWEEVLQTGNEDAIVKMAQTVLNAREDWLVMAQSGMWETEPQGKERMPTFSTWMFGESLARVLRSGK